MANNRMFLVNDRLGARVFLGKYYPSTGWGITDPDIAQKINAAFEAETNEGVPDGLIGPTDWRIEYESVPGDVDAKIDLTRAVSNAFRRPAQ